MQRQHTNFKSLDTAIDKATAVVVATVPNAKFLGIRTAVIINGEFKLISDYDVPFDVAEDLLWQADKLDANFLIESV